MGHIHFGGEEAGIIDRQAGHEHDLLSLGRQREHHPDGIVGSEVDGQDVGADHRATVGGLEQHRESVVGDVLLDGGRHGASDLDVGHHRGVGLGQVQQGEHQGRGAVAGAGQAGPLVRVVEGGAAVQAGPLQQHEPEAAELAGNGSRAGLAVGHADRADEAGHEGPGRADAAARQVHGEAGVAREAEVGEAEAGVALGPAGLAEGALLEEARLALALVGLGEEVAREAAGAGAGRAHAARAAAVAADAGLLGQDLSGQAGAEALLVEQVVLALLAPVQGAAAHAARLAGQTLEPLGKEPGWAEAGVGGRVEHEVGLAGLAVIYRVAAGGAANRALEAEAEDLGSAGGADAGAGGADLEAQAASEARHPPADLAQGAAGQTKSARSVQVGGHGAGAGRVDQDERGGAGPAVGRVVEAPRAAGRAEGAGVRLEEGAHRTLADTELLVADEGGLAGLAEVGSVGAGQALVAAGLAQGADHVEPDRTQAGTADQDVGRPAALAVGSGGGAGGALQVAGRAGELPLHLADLAAAAGAVQDEGQGASQAVAGRVHARGAAHLAGHAALVPGAVDGNGGADADAVLHREGRGADAARRGRGAPEAARGAGSAGAQAQEVPDLAALAVPRSGRAGRAGRCRRCRCRSCPPA